MQLARQPFIHNNLAHMQKDPFTFLANTVLVVEQARDLTLGHGRSEYINIEVLRTMGLTDMKGESRV